KADGAACDDGDACSFNDSCDGSGQCVGTAITCTSDQCNTRTCNGTSSCTVTPNTGAACDDGNDRKIDVKGNGSGLGVGPAITCTTDHGNATSLNCTPSFTLTPPAGTTCDDGDACSFNDTCDGSGQCIGTVITCTSDQCNTQTCNGTSSCTVTPNTGAACDDG